MRLDIVSNWLKRFRCPFCDKQKKYKKKGRCENKLNRKSFLKKNFFFRLFRV